MGKIQVNAKDILILVLLFILALGCYWAAWQTFIENNCVGGGGTFGVHEHPCYGIIERILTGLFDLALGIVWTCMFIGTIKLFKKSG